MKRHPKQAFVWQTVKRHPDRCYWQTVKRHPDRCYLICGQPGAGKSAVLWALYAHAVEQGRPTRFAGEMIYRLLDAAYSYRHQLVVTSQLDRRGLERHWAEAGDGYGEAIMRRVSEIHGAAYLTLLETDGDAEKRRAAGF